MNRFDGSPAVYLTLDGADIVFKGGQPVMDDGLENQALIALFTGDWIGNALFADPKRHIGSAFEASADQPITLSALADVEREAKAALQAKDAFGNVTAEARNPVSHRIDVEITIEPPAGDAQELKLSKYAGVWQNQAGDPASGRVAGAIGDNSTWVLRNGKWNDFGKWWSSGVWK